MTDYVNQTRGRGGGFKRAFGRAADSRRWTGRIQTRQTSESGGFQETSVRSEHTLCVAFLLSQSDFTMHPDEPGIRAQPVKLGERGKAGRGSREFSAVGRIRDLHLAAGAKRPAYRTKWAWGAGIKAVNFCSICRGVRIMWSFRLATHA